MCFGICFSRKGLVFYQNKQIFRATAALTRTSKVYLGSWQDNSLLRQRFSSDDLSSFGGLSHSFSWCVILHFNVKMEILWGSMSQVIMTANGSMSLKRRQLNWTHLAFLRRNFPLLNWALLQCIYTALSAFKFEIGKGRSAGTLIPMPVGRLWRLAGLTKLRLLYQPLSLQDFQRKLSWNSEKTELNSGHWVFGKAQHTENDTSSNAKPLCIINCCSAFGCGKRIL